MVSAQRSRNFYSLQSVQLMQSCQRTEKVELSFLFLDALSSLQLPSALLSVSNSLNAVSESMKHVCVGVRHGSFKFNGPVFLSLSKNNVFFLLSLADQVRDSERAYWSGISSFSRCLECWSSSVFRRSVGRRRQREARKASESECGGVGDSKTTLRRGVHRRRGERQRLNYALHQPTTIQRY